MMGRMRRRMFGISPEETSVSKRGFSVTDPAIKARLEEIGIAFVAGYHAAIETPRPDLLAAKLETLNPELRGFAYEGAGMGLALLDILLPWQQRLQLFYSSTGSAHLYMIQIGAGWALARLHRPARPWINRLDPLTKWLALDGYGFHEGYFNWQKSISRGEYPERLQGYERRGFDQGIGRCLWFVKGGDVDRIFAAVMNLAEERRADIWSGVGLAATYAGGVDSVVLRRLIEAAGHEYYAALAQGAVFAAKTRQHAGNPSPHTYAACLQLTGLSLEDAALLFDAAGVALPPDDDLPAFEIWRQRIQARFLHQRLYQEESFA